MSPEPKWGSHLIRELPETTRAYTLPKPHQAQHLKTLKHWLNIDQLCEAHHGLSKPDKLTTILELKVISQEKLEKFIPYPALDSSKGDFENFFSAIKMQLAPEWNILL